MRISLQSTVLDYIRECRASKLDPQTIRWYTQKLETVIRLLTDLGVKTTDDLTAAALHEAISGLSDGTRSTYTVRGYVQVIKGWLHFLEDEEMIGPRIRNRIKMPKVEKRIIPTLRVEDQEALIGAANIEMHKWMVQRDRAILRLLLDTGIRASELCTLTTSNTHLDDADSYITVVGKGKKEREVGPLSLETRRAIARYLRAQPRGKDEVLFINRYHQPLTVSGLDQILYRLRDWAGLEGVEVRAHVFRHTYATTKLREGMDIKRLSLLLGHTSVVTTEVYLRDFAQREARREPRFHEHI